MENKDDLVIQALLKEHTEESKKLYRYNWIVGVAMLCALVSYPLFASKRELPFHMWVPFLNLLETPTYQIMFTMQFIFTTFACWMYIPFTNFYSTASLFALIQMKTLKHLLSQIKENDDVKEVDKKLNGFIEMHQKIINYVEELNNLITFICTFELFGFGISLSSQLLNMIIVMFIFHSKLNQL